MRVRVHGHVRVCVWMRMQDNEFLPMVGLFVALYVGLVIYSLFFTWLTKWLVIGRYKEGTYPLWGSYYLRW